jgi:hypothetical protein
LVHEHKYFRRNRFFFFFFCNFEYNYTASSSTGHCYTSDIASQVFTHKIHKFRKFLFPYCKNSLFDALRFYAKFSKWKILFKFGRQAGSFSGTNKYGSNPTEVLRQHALQTARGCLTLQRPHIKYGYTARHLMLYIPIRYSKSDPRRCLLESPESGGVILRIAVQRRDLFITDICT